jgi:hypothetical protein
MLAGHWKREGSFDSFTIHSKNQAQFAAWLGRNSKMDTLALGLNAYA